MARRKAVTKQVKAEEEASDLSPPPAGLLKEEPAVKGTNRADETSKGKKRKRKTKETKNEEPVHEDVKAPTKRGKRRKVEEKEEEEEVVAGAEEQNGGVVEKKVKRKRKTKEEKEAEAMPLAARTVGHKLYIGAHVSSAGGVHNSVVNSVHIGANAFALFLKSQRKWANPPLADEARTTFHSNCSSHSYDQTQHVVPHGSYLVNLAHTDKARTTQAYDAFLDDLQRCEKLGITLYNFHPGVANSTNGDRQVAIAHLASNLNKAHKATSKVVTLLENMAAGGNVLGSTFEDLRDTIALIDDKERVGVCLDTCHAFASGYDLRTPEAFKATMKKFEATVGFKYLRAMHINDSKAPFASHKDLHANIGTGFLGLRAFHNIVNEPRFQGLPLILETPIESRDEDGALLKDEKGKEKEDKGIWAREIKLLESMVGMDLESEEFSSQEKALAKRGAPERQRLTDQIEKKREKDEKKAKTPKKKKQGKKGVKGEAADEEDSMSAASPLSDLSSDHEVNDGTG
ncbi:DNA-(apurinic or apyrimidinic site) lyase [Saxophila tyrrhenica]|uniref:Apurinic-apyrimidinic endonuclease 1 n=1 Tax=Saxophila tyrrhenica TaxID=1690608 RepID=A0AAV9P759_9PEZI|nr:DNA-(apurinic or apyrimidinic site) lyase [Saxophila tyrrhenica]